jgi:hypothetical protein
MTIGQIQEVVVSKLGAVLGCEVDATAFTQHGVFGDNIANLLMANGFDAHGDEMMYSGVTGEILHSKIFIGPTYYMRLKHMSADKINYRGGGLVDRGPVDARTRQPIGGRAREGGLRIGEMERDSVISHGAARFLQESLTVRADGEHSLLCAESGKQAVRGDGKSAYPGLRSVERDGPFHYRGSTADTLENTTHTTKVTRYSEIPMPRGLRVLTQEMESMGIDTRIFTDGGAQRLRSSMIGGKPVIPKGTEPPPPRVVTAVESGLVQKAMGRNPEPDESMSLLEDERNETVMSLTDALEEHIKRRRQASEAFTRGKNTLMEVSSEGEMGNDAALAAQIKRGKEFQEGLLSSLEVAQANTVTPTTQEPVPNIPPPTTPMVTPPPQIATKSEPSESKPQEGEKIVIVKEG